VKLMKISVLMPAYNASRTIEATIAAVLRQTVAPWEFLIVDDGSADNTAAIAERFAPNVRVIRTANQGAAAARNTLCARATGELLAFLDADDIWHPQHLEVHCALAARFPQAVARFSDHLNFSGYDDHRWQGGLAAKDSELIPALDFFRRYHKGPGPFSSMSFCSIPQSTVERLGPDPFQVNGAEDYFLFTRIALLGPIAYEPAQTVAYRFHPASLSSNKLRVVGLAVRVYEVLEPEYQQYSDKRFLSAFRKAFASKRRLYAKLLLGANEKASARNQLRRSLANLAPSSLIKSLGLLTFSYFPAGLRPRWPQNTRTGVVSQ
jgi:Glycosyltransferases involved in cell wall biogenesis